MVEIDIHKCRTGELVIMHDETVDRTTNGSGPISEMTLKQLSSLQPNPHIYVPGSTQRVLFSKTTPWKPVPVAAGFVEKTGKSDGF